MGNWCGFLEEGHIEVVQLLLQDSRVDPSAKNNRAILAASQNGHTKVVQLLIADERVITLNKLDSIHFSFY